MVPDRSVWLQRLAILARRFHTAMLRSFEEATVQLRSRSERLQRAHPGARLIQHAQRLDELELRLRRALDSQLREASSQSEAMSLRTANLSERLRAAWLRSLAAAQGRLELSARALQGVSPLATLHRGFAILTRGSDGTIIRQRAQLTIGDPIEARVADGVITALVTGTRES